MQLATSFSCQKTTLMMKWTVYNHVESELAIPTYPRMLRAGLYASHVVPTTQSFQPYSHNRFAASPDTDTRPSIKPEAVWTKDTIAPCPPPLGRVTGRSLYVSLSVLDE